MLTKPDFDAFLKEYWTNEVNEKFTYQNRPLMAMMPKSTDLGGEYWVIPVEVDIGADGSPDFNVAMAVAQASGTDTLRRQFQVPIYEDFQIARISNKLIRVSRDAPRLALQKAVVETSNKRDKLATRLARTMYGTGYGEIATVSTAISALNTKVLGIANKKDLRNFGIGTQLQFAQTSTAALRDTGDYVSVVAVDFDAQKVTTDAAVDLSTSITGIANGDVVFIRGGRLVGLNPAQQTFPGLGSWIPTTAPVLGADSFNGVDRGVYPDRLAGLRYNAGAAVSGPIQEVLIDALTDAAIREAYVTHMFMDPGVYGDGLKALEGTVDRIQEKGVNVSGSPTSIGFNGFSINVGFGSNGVKVFPDGNCPSKRSYGLTLDTWDFKTAGELIQNDLQASEKRDVENASAVEWRYVFCGSMGCNAPGKNQVIVWA